MMDDYDCEYGNFGEEYDDDMDHSEFDPQDFRGNKFNRGNRRGGGFGRFGPPMMGGNFGPPPFMCPPPFLGRGFGPRGPPNQRFDNRPAAFLMSCGVLKENLRGLPRVLLELMEPEYCGLCAYSLDNYSVARLHYLSKNHQKNQKKWLLHNQRGPHRSTEVPLKSRDLYCELCDVHITSKSHSESHYAGKQHRSIVEGRKNPKNPILLQRGMQDRINQLIRREKKHLKPVEEAEETEDAEKKETKPISPELYCEICKATVTCSEQMTSHLNGKRHLAKEKQHILKMMKGEVKGDADGAVQESVVAGNSGGDDNGDGAPAENNAQEEEDWANGGGTNWDDAQQN